MSPRYTSDPLAASEIRAGLVASAPLSERREQLAGVSTALLEGGHGPPLVLLHGPGEFWGVWLNVVGDLVDSHRVVVVDLPGHGDSLRIEGKLDADRVMAWVEELIDATCDAPPVLVGHLLGGAIAARYAVGNSDRLSHLVLVDPMGLTWYRPSPRFAIPMVRFMAKPTPETRDRFFHECFVDFDQVGERFGDVWDDVRDYALDRARTSENKAAMKALMAHIGVPAIPSDDLAAITVPTTLIHGRHDLQVSLRVAQRASQRYGWPLHVIDGARDDPAAEQPQAFLEAVRVALAQERDPVRTEDRP
jgi:pimeloyl-ACP methyl ester carboxylesterase